MRYRIYDNVDKKYIPEEHAKHFFCLDIYGKVVKYNHVLGFMETGNRYTAEKSTGLKDKNGVEIYEGDILGGCNGSINGYGMNDKWTVSWTKARAEFKMPVWAYDSDGEYTRDDSTHWFEIIGNMHGAKKDEE